MALTWNILYNTNVKANFENIPETSIKPYIEYNLGVQKTIGERFTGFGQGNVQKPGGRNGIDLTFGFR